MLIVIGLDFEKINEDCLLQWLNSLFCQMQVQSVARLKLVLSDNSVRGTEKCICWLVFIH